MKQRLLRCNMKTTPALAFVLLTSSALCGLAQQPDIILADFEGADYGEWTKTGEAFGAGPAHGTLPGQMQVDGFLGNGLANSYHGGDPSTGTLTSRPFKIDRKFITFLIGGGGFAGKTCMNLLVEGKVVRTATGPNTAPGGSEDLSPALWDVSEFAGKSAEIEIVDKATGCWGHINVDQIALSDKATAATAALVSRERELTIEKRYLHLPVKNNSGKRKNQHIAVLVDGAVVREFECNLSDAPDWFAHLDMTAWQGKKATVRVEKLAEDSKALDLVTQADTIWGADRLYKEPLRGQLHFSPRRGWNNDPNGMVFADGEYHLFFQHNPYGWAWGNMHWGHAVSPDMVHWTELPIALYPHKFGDGVFSGGALVDKDNSSGWKNSANSLIVASFTSTGRGQCIVYSNDRGRTFQEFDGNPVITHANRDPRPLWYAPAKHWVIAVYDEFEKGQNIAFYTSPDLKSWTFQSRIKGFYECPDLFELPVDGDAAKKKWVLTAASSDYMIGQFDGKQFIPETPKLKGNLGRGFYAAQTFSNEPKGRVVQIGWLQTGTPGMPFNQAMSLPLELKLRNTQEGPRLTWTPVTELESLRGTAFRHGALTLNLADANPLENVMAELLEVRADFAPGGATEVAFTVRGVPVVYFTEKMELSVNGLRVPAPLVSGHQKIVVYADRTALEVFASDGLVYVPMPVAPKADNCSVQVTAKGGAVEFERLDAYGLKSIWK